MTGPFLSSDDLWRERMRMSRKLLNGLRTLFKADRLHILPSEFEAVQHGTPQNSFFAYAV